MLRGDFPCWSTVSGLFRSGVRSGVWETIHDRLREQFRQAVGKKKRWTSVVILDSQSVRTAEGGLERGDDGANWPVQDGACFLLMKFRRLCPRLKVLHADSACGRNELLVRVSQTFGWGLQVVLRPMGIKKFMVVSKRWIVERTFAWLARYRRHTRDYERTPKSSEAVTYLAMINIVNKRLGRMIC